MVWSHAGDLATPPRDISYGTWVLRCWISWRSEHASHAAPPAPQQPSQGRRGTSSKPFGELCPKCDVTLNL